MREQDFSDVMDRGRRVESRPKRFVDDVLHLGHYSQMKQVSVTDLKNSLSARMKLVLAGESLLITDHRKPVAVLSPLAEGMHDEGMAALVAAGLVSPPRRRLDVKALLKLPRGRATRSLSAAVLDDREGR